MGRPRTGKAQGRTSHFSGEKLEWLESFRQQILDAGEDPGPVYTDVTNLFLLRYGYDLPFSDNVDGNPDEHPPPPLGNPSPAEQSRRDELREKLRAVSAF